MACRIPLTGAQTRGFNRLRGDRAAQRPGPRRVRRAGWATLLQAHHYTDGLELLPHGAPTNNTDDVKSALTTQDPNYAALYALEQGPTLCPAGPTADGDRLARALGVEPALLAHVRGADGGQDEQAGAMNTVLWPATWGYYLEPDGGWRGRRRSARSCPAAARPLHGHVRARGHFPILRIGAQPYGVLPVMWSAHWKPLDGRAAGSAAHGAAGAPARDLGEFGRERAAAAGRGRSRAALVAILGMSPASASYVARNMIGPGVQSMAFGNSCGRTSGQAWWSALAVRSLAESADLGRHDGRYAAGECDFRPISTGLLTDLMVAPAPLDGQLRRTMWQQSRRSAGRRCAICRCRRSRCRCSCCCCATRCCASTSTRRCDLLGNAGAVQRNRAERLEPELLGLSAAASRGRRHGTSCRGTAGKGPVGAFLDGAKRDSTRPSSPLSGRALPSLRPCRQRRWMPRPAKCWTWPPTASTPG